ncbi:hypothetical protein C9374_012933 [Naegleria lovaniensis]|uniref:Uncharacterized protein n=1 Tax=Naegleria lovaniensis TaxID=51637 RepID=A0AA88G6F7_NAELO|nr:uncharacterized protein C9374_012933 [Naegleria lovaniensis]KAG2372990.1 hypothetical protein C9374_012933 [Naegleria lovaniensis]
MNLLRSRKLILIVGTMILTLSVTMVFQWIVFPQHNKSMNSSHLDSSMTTAYRQHAATSRECTCEPTTNASTLNQNNNNMQKRRNQRVFPITFFSNEYITHGRNYDSSWGMGALCGVYLQSYFSYNLKSTDMAKEGNHVETFPTIIGQEDRPGTYGHWRKYIILDQFLKSEASNYIKEDDFVFFSDGLDVTFNGNVQHIKDVYYEYLKDENFDVEKRENENWPILFNSEKNKWPPLSLFKGIKNLDFNFLQQHYVNNYPKNKPYCPSNSGFQYLNSGMYVARKRDVKAYLVAAFNMVENPQMIYNDDQAAVQIMYVAKSSSQYYPVLGDCRAAMGLPTYIACDHLQVVNETYCHVSNKEIPERIPIAMHSNGPKCDNFCPCVRAKSRSSKLKQFMDFEIEKQKGVSFTDLNINLKVLFYNSNSNKVNEIVLNGFCSAKLLFDIPNSGCIPK